MISLISIFTFIGFYFWYCTTKRIPVQNIFGIEDWIKEKMLTTKIVGSIFFIFSCVLHIYTLGIGSGVLAFFILFMTIGSLIIILAPMRLLTYGSLCITLIISLIIEMKLF